LIIPSQKLSTNISFLMDTGADVTNLMPMDAGKMGLDYTKLTDTDESVGVGGLSVDYTEPAVLVFLDAGKRNKLRVYFITVHISSPSPDIMDLPSLLGRDVIDNWRIDYNPMKPALKAIVRKADVTLPA
jgi:hypothetical protein